MTRFAVEMRHLLRVVAVAGGLAWRYGGIDVRKFSGSEIKRKRAERILELLGAARADHWHDVGSARTDPSDCKLGWACAFFLSDPLQRVHELQIFVDIAALKARHAHDANIAFGIGRRHAAAQQPPRRA